MTYGITCLYIWCIATIYTYFIRQTDIILNH